MTPSLDTGLLSPFHVPGHRTTIQAPIGFIDRGPSSVEINQGPDSNCSRRVQTRLANMWLYITPEAA